MVLSSKGSFRVSGRAAVGFPTCLESLVQAGWGIFPSLGVSCPLCLWQNVVLWLVNKQASCADPSALRVAAVEEIPMHWAQTVAGRAVWRGSHRAFSFHVIPDQTWVLWCCHFPAGQEGSWGPGKLHFLAVVSGRAMSAGPGPGFQVCLLWAFPLVFPAFGLFDLSNYWWCIDNSNTLDIVRD